MITTSWLISLQVTQIQTPHSTYLTMDTKIQLIIGVIPEGPVYSEAPYDKLFDFDHFMMFGKLEKKKKVTKEEKENTNSNN